MANREELALIRGARNGQVTAQLALGKRYLFGGEGLPQSIPTALHWLERAARQECQEAWMLIGSYIPFAAAQQSADPVALCIWYERAFDAGVPEAGLVLARLVLAQDSQLVEPALRDKALKALQAAAHAGLADAQWLLAQHTAADLTTIYNAAGQPSDQEPAAHVVTPEAAIAAADVEATLEWAVRAADGGVLQAQRAVADHAWESGDHAGFLRWALPLARQVVYRGQFQMHAADAPKLTTRCLSDDDVKLLTRCAQILVLAADGEPVDPAEVHRFWEIAAQEDDKGAQLALGLWFARMDADGIRIASASGSGASANFKKAIRWLTLAGEQGLAEAWYALSRIYLKPEFSQRSVAMAQTYLERAAEMGHGTAQLECGASAWRTRRENEANDVRAVYWLQKAAAQGNADAVALLEKIALRARPAAWAEQALRQLTRDQINSHPFLAARIELAALFGLSRAEALLLDLNSADQGHCLLVDIRANYGRSKRYLISLETGQERQVLDRIARLFEDVDCGVNGPEGNYRQRLYRLKSLLPSADQAEPTESEPEGQLAAA